jgi:hypothetical protein
LKLQGWIVVIDIAARAASCLTKAPPGIRGGFGQGVERSSVDKMQHVRVIRLFGAGIAGLNDK